MNKLRIYIYIYIAYKSLYGFEVGKKYVQKQKGKKSVLNKAEY